MASLLAALLKNAKAFQAIRFRQTCQPALNKRDSRELGVLVSRRSDKPEGRVRFPYYRFERSVCPFMTFKGMQFGTTCSHLDSLCDPLV